MYIEDFKSEFYDYLAGKRVFLIINYDIDSICACKILQSLFRYLNVLYTIVVVQGINDLKRVYSEHRENVQFFILLNCGGTIDIVEELEAEEEKVFFILDSHRPIDVCNIYSTSQVRLLNAAESDAQVPQFQDIFRDETDSEDNDDDDDDNDDGNNSSREENRTTKRRRLDEDALMKRREKRLWEENRNKLLFEYTQFAYYARPSSIYLFEFAWKLNKDDKELLWLAIIALTEQLLFGKIEETHYVIEMESLRAHCKRLHNRINETDVVTSLQISFEKDLKLTLYRHWTVENSIKYSTFTAVKLKLWTLKGDKKICELLAEMGLPLAQSRQQFKSMDLQLRKEFHEAIEKISKKFDIEDISFTSFTLKYGYQLNYCASDFVFAMLAILEASPHNKNPEELFNLTLDCLTKRKKDVIDNAIDRAKLICKTLFKTVQSALEMKQIVTAGPFVYYILQEGSREWYMFSHQHILSLLAQFLLKAYVSVSRNRRAATLPLIVSAPKNLDDGTCILIGVPPICENSPRNFFGKAFEQAAERMNYEVTSDYFDTSYFEIHTKNRTRFLDALAALLN